MDVQILLGILWSIKMQKTNEWYKWDDGWFEYYVNIKTGEKKFELEPGDIEIFPIFDDFCRDIKE